MESTTPDVPPSDEKRPIPDLGFFAGAPRSGLAQGSGAAAFSAPRPSSTFGAPTATSQFGAPPHAPPQFGAPPQPGSQFGGPALPAQWGGPSGASAAQPSGSQAASNALAVKVGATVVALVLLVVGVIGGRFAWSQFVATPVVPNTLDGLARVTDPSFEAGLQAAQDSVANGLTKGSKTKVALYTDGQGRSLMLFAVRGSDGQKGDQSQGPLAGWTESTFGKSHCWTSPGAATGPSITMCMRAFWRRAVMVLNLGRAGADPVTIARATDEAWAAQ